MSFVGIVYPCVYVIQLLNCSSSRHLELQCLDFPSWRWCFYLSFTLCRRGDENSCFTNLPQKKMHVCKDFISVETIKQLFTLLIHECFI